MRRILYVIYTLQAGGIESLGMNIFRNIDRSNYQFDFLVIKDQSEKQFYDDEVTKLGGHIIAVGNPAAKYFKKYLATELGIRKVIKYGNYDVVHINSGHIHTLPEIIMAKMYGVKNIITHSHSEGLKKTTRFYKLRCFVQKFYRFIVPHIADHLLTCSDLAAKWAYSKKSIKAGRVIQINNGVLPEKYHYSREKREEFRNKLGVGNELMIGHVGRFDIRKNHKFILETLLDIQKTIPDAKAIFCGAGELEDEMKAYAIKIGIDKNVIFYGVTKNVQDILNAIDIFVFPSISEGLPVVGVEAQAAGLPVFASDVITKDIAITPVWKTLSLDIGPNGWAESIIDEYRKQEPRMDTSQLIKDAGFDIRETADMISRIYDMM